MKIKTRFQLKRHLFEVNSRKKLFPYEFEYKKEIECIKMKRKKLDFSKSGFIQFSMLTNSEKKK